MAYCSQCGKQIPQEANYCRHCGSITRQGKASAAMSNVIPDPGPVEQIPSGISDTTMQALRRKLQTLMRTDTVPFQRQEIAMLGNVLGEDETLLETLSVKPDGLVVATSDRIICIRKEPPTLSLTTTLINDPDIEAICAQKIGTAVRIRVSVSNGPELSFVTSDKELAHDFIELIEFTINMYAEDSSETVSRRPHHRMGYSHTDEDDDDKKSHNLPDERNESLESLKLLLTASMPLVIMYLKHKQASGQAPTIVELAGKIGIPAMAMPMLMPLLLEKLTEFLGENHNLPLFK